MAYADSPVSELTLGALLRSFTTNKSLAPQHFSKMFNFCHDIFIISRLPNTIDTLLWNVILAMFDLFICCVSCPFDWFKNINITTDDLGTSKFLTSKVRLQLLSMLAIVASLLFFLFFWISFLTYNPKKSHLNNFHATALHLIVVHIPLIIDPLIGLLFGSLLISNIDSSLAQYTTTAISISLSITFLFYLGTITIFNIITNYSLTLRTGQFAYWRPPIRTIDCIVIFLSAMFIPVRMGYEPKAATVIAVIQFVYGTYLLFTLKNITFISLVALTMQIKIAVDAMIYPIYTIINVWLPYSNIMTFSVFVIISFVGICISLLILSILFNYSQTKLASFTQTKLPSSEAAVSMLRFGINLSMPSVTRTEFIKWIAMWRFSFDLVPDIVRLCIVTHRSIDEIIIPHKHCGPLKQIPLMFLAFQLDLYECYASNDGDPRVDAKRDELKLLLQRSEFIIDNFWTDPMYDQVNLRMFGSKLQSIVNKFTTAVVLFPHSKEIANLWEKFTSDIFYIQLPSQVTSNTPVELLYNPATTIYGFLRSDISEHSAVKEKKRSSIDWYFDHIIKKSSCPLIVYLFLFFISYIVFTIVIGVFTYDLSRSQLDHFVNTSTFVRLQTELANEKIAEIEPYVPMPSYREISKLLGIDEEMASTFVSKRIPARSELSNLTSLYSYINTFPKPPDPQKCKDISFVLLLKYKLPKDSNIDAVYCQMLYINFYSQYIANISQSIIWNYSPKNKIGTVSVGIFIVIFMSVSTFFFILALKNDIYRRKKMIAAVKSVIHMKQRLSKPSKYEIGLVVVFNTIVWIVIMAITAILYVACVVPSNRENYRVTRILQQIAMISGISRASQNSLAYSASHFMHNLTIPNIIGYLSNSRDELVEQVNSLTELGIDTIFDEIKPLDCWTANGTESFSSLLLDYSQLLANKNLTNDFKFYYARFIFLFNISILIESTLPKMVDTAQLTMQKVSSVYVISGMVLICVLIICMLFLYIEYRKKLSWYYAATAFLRRSILKNPQNLVKIQRILSNPENDYLEELPFALIAKEKNGPILYTNTKTSDYVNYSTVQLIGQKMENIFRVQNKLCTVNVGGKSITLNVESHQIGNNHEIITMNDITDLFESRQTYHQMLKEMKPNIKNLPMRNKMYYLEVRINPNNTDSNEILNSFDEAEESFQQKAIRISCGITFYTALIPKTCENSELLNFLNALIVKSNGDFIIALVYGLLSCFPIDDDKTRVVACGDSAERAHDCICHGRWGRAYFDEYIISKIGSKAVSRSQFLEEHLVAISPLEPPQD